MAAVGVAQHAAVGALFVPGGAGRARDGQLYFPRFEALAANADVGGAVHPQYGRGTTDGAVVGHDHVGELHGIALGEVDRPHQEEDLAVVVAAGIDFRLVLAPVARDRADCIARVGRVGRGLCLVVVDLVVRRVRLQRHTVHDHRPVVDVPLEVVVVLRQHKAVALTLNRHRGRSDLGAIGVNQVVGERFLVGKRLLDRDDLGRAGRVAGGRQRDKE